MPGTQTATRKPITGAHNPNIPPDELDEYREHVGTLPDGSPELRSLLLQSLDDLEGAYTRIAVAYRRLDQATREPWPSQCGCPTGSRYTIHHTGACEERGRKPALWAVHVQGSDEYIAAESREAADQIKAQLDHFDAANTRRTDFPKASAVVVPWPHSADAHALAVETEETYAGAKA